LDVVTGAKTTDDGVPGSYSYGTGTPVRRDRSTVAVAVAVIGVIGLLAGIAGVVVRLLPRHFSAAQQQAITAWEMGNRWRQLSAGQIFPSTVSYTPPAAIDDLGSGLSLTARRIGIARQASCSSASSPVATDSAAATVLARGGCQAVLRATYTDDTDSYVVTVGVAVFPSTAKAASARQQLDSSTLSLGKGRAPGVSTVPFTRTPAASFTDARRQIASNVAEGPYLVMYAIGYADSRPLVPVSADSYTDAEMTSLGSGVAEEIASVLGSAPAAPHCPGAPGC
jgi:hypothetical protein